MESNTPPEEYPEKKTIEFVYRSLKRDFIWIEEHLSSFAAARDVDPKHAEQELRYLINAVEHGKRNLDQLGTSLNTNPS